MKKASKKLYQKVTNKPKKFGNNNVNSINIILNPEEEKQLQKSAGAGAGPQVLQELARITPPSLEDARQILGKTQRDNENSGKTIGDIQQQGIQQEVAEVIDNAKVAQETQTENEALAEQIASQQDALASLAEIAIQTDPIDTSNDDEAMEQYHRQMQNTIYSLEQDRADDMRNIQMLSELVERISAEATYQTAGNLGEIVRNNLAGRVAQDVFNSPPPRSPLLSDLRSTTPPTRGPIFNTPTAPRGNNPQTRVQDNSQQVPLPASFNSHFALGTDVQERYNRPTRPKKKINI